MMEVIPYKNKLIEVRKNIQIQNHLMSFIWIKWFDKNIKEVYHEF